MLKCGECGGNYVLVNKTHYGCAQHKERGGAACGNGIQVRRDLAEARLLEGIKRDLLSSEALDYMRRETARLIAEHKKAEHPVDADKRLRELEREIGHLVDAIRAGGAKTSPALLDALTKAEQEKESLLQTRVRTRPQAELPDIMTNLQQSYTRMVERLERHCDSDIPTARNALTALLGERIPLHPNRQEGYLTAEIGVNMEGLLAAGGNAGNKIMLVAGAGFGHSLIDLK